MRLTSSLAGMLTVMLATYAGSAPAQTGMTTPDRGQVAGLFMQSCMKFAGDTAGLRDWASAHHLPQAPPEQAAAFLGTLGPGEVFGASNASGKYALISYDSGMCRAIAFIGNTSDIRQTLLSLLHGREFSVVPVLVRAKPDGSSRQELFKVHLGSQDWGVSITTKPHAEVPSMAPEVGLLATVEHSSATLPLTP